MSLKDLPEKLKLKEFKRIAKDLKSKDIDIKNAAIKISLSEHLYLTEGKGFNSLLESVVSKKVQIKNLYYLHQNNIFFCMKF